jgi:hypothetical protein
VDVIDIRRRLDEVELERVNLEVYYADQQRRLSKMGDDPAEVRELLQQAVNALNVEREHAGKPRALVSEFKVAWVRARWAERDQRGEV